MHTQCGDHFEFWHAGSHRRHNHPRQFFVNQFRRFGVLPPPSRNFTISIGFAGRSVIDKLQKFACHYNSRKYSFCSRIVYVWNSLPNNVVEADTINIFKNRLDKHWINQEVLFNFSADLTGSGSLPICM